MNYCVRPQDAALSRTYMQVEHLTISQRLDRNVAEGIACRLAVLVVAVNIGNRFITMNHTGSLHQPAVFRLALDRKSAVAKHGTLNVLGGKLAFPVGKTQMFLAFEQPREVEFAKAVVLQHAVMLAVVLSARFEPERQAALDADVLWLGAVTLRRLDFFQV